MRFKSKKEFISTIEEEWNKAWKLIDSYSDEDLIKRVKPKRGVAWSVKDALVHVYEWHLMVMDWYKVGLKGVKPDMPCKGYTWKTCPDLNKAIYEKHKNVPLKKAKRLVKASHKKMFDLIKSLSEKQLLSPGSFDWTGKNPLTTYFAGNTLSHYRWLQRKVKKIMKELGK